MADKRVRVILAGQEVKFHERYDVRCEIFTQPAGFSLDFATSEPVYKFAEAYPPNTPFQLKLGDNPLMTGTTDGFETTAGSNGSSVTLFGRDPLAALIRSQVPSDIHLSGKTYLGLLEFALEKVGITNPTILGSNEANRKVITGFTSSTTVGVFSPNTNDGNGIEISRGFSAGTSGASRFNPNPRGGANRFGIEYDTDFSLDAAVLAPKTSVSEVNGQVTARVGDTWFEFLTSYYNKAGLFLWCGARGEFILSRPDIKQTPIYRLVRKKGVSNIENGSFKFDTTDRSAFSSTYGRTGGTKTGRLTFKGGSFDQEMLDFGFTNLLSASDGKISSQSHAEDLAVRKISEQRRKGVNISYEVTGHEIKGIGGGTYKWCPDTMVEVEDEDMGLFGAFYVGGVNYSCSNSGEMTKLTVYRAQDLLFEKAKNTL